MKTKAKETLKPYKDTLDEVSKFFKELFDDAYRTYEAYNKKKNHDDAQMSEHEAYIIARNKKFRALKRQMENKIKAELVYGAMTAKQKRRFKLWIKGKNFTEIAEIESSKLPEGKKVSKQAVRQSILSAKRQSELCFRL